MKQLEFKSSAYLCICSFDASSFALYVNTWRIQSGVNFLCALDMHAYKEGCYQFW